MQHIEDCLSGDPTSTQFTKLRTRAGFSLIELLVVIAIIAILMAILFPVFATVRENAREGNTMAHMQEISAALALYKLDNKSYPPVLFAYACDSAASAADSCGMGDTMQTISHDTNAKNELVGLYPEYVPDWHTFVCDSDDNNDPGGKYKTTDKSGAATGPQPDYVGTDYALHAADGSTNYPYRSYFTDDAFDVNPEVSGRNKLVGSAGASYGTYNYILRYQTSWTSFYNNYASTPGATPFDTNYVRQLRWQNPPANTFVTAVTYHIPSSDRLFVLYEGGFVQKLDIGTNFQGPPVTGAWIEPPLNAQGSVDLTAPGSCTTDATSGIACNYSNATFWQFNKGQ